MFCVLIVFTLTYFKLSNKVNEGCTSWIATGESLAGGKVLLHKNRDSDTIEMEVIEVRNGLYKYLGLIKKNPNDNDIIQDFGGINETGLAVCSNFVPYTY
ncbi:MAG: hypothetical protein SVZ03_06750 [Spirochaetota bacterium]|nr:hypothetical protein [Spirochaetota bacterium]